ncbi:MAG: hypothetical protein ACOX0K_05140 [Oscillospiraceae bacterium]|jgi:hypothetical protein
MKKSYDDIIHLPRPISKTRPKMAVADRAAQFSPFAALTGFEAAVKETARLTDERVELDEDRKRVLNDQLQIIAERIKERPEISITYFQPDSKKTGGAYRTVTGTAKKIDEYHRVVTLTDGTAIPIHDITCMDGEIFKTVYDG